MYLFLERGDGREKDWKRNIDRLPLLHLPTRDQIHNPGTESTTQARAPTGNHTGGLSLGGTMPEPLSHTGQGLSPF